MEGTPSRSWLLELKDEQTVMAEGFRFLDEKRLLLAAEILRELDRFERVRAEWLLRYRTGAQAMGVAVGRHGLQEVTCYPVQPNEAFALEIGGRDFFGVKLVQASLLGSVPPPPVPAWPSPGIEACREIFVALLDQVVAMAVLSTNLHRLMADYQSTSRRARALEDVILPEISGSIRELTDRLEEMEQEEAVRSRLHKEA